MISIPQDLTLEKIYQGRARNQHLDFVKYTWQRPDPFIVGLHTRGICQAIDQACDDYENGKSSFLVVTVAFRHGKSELVSRYLPAHFLGRFPSSEIILTSHSDDKAQEFSKFGRRLIRSPEFKALYANIELASDNQGVQEWGLSNGLGKAQYFGIGAGSAGKGANLLIIDDYFSKREHAESDVYRKRVWESFSDDLMTRRAPVSIVLVVVTPWHVDDLVGRIKKSMKDNPEFPRFKFISYPAFSDKYKDGILFPERFSKEWYNTQKATLGVYGTASLMQCDPQVRESNMIRTDKVQVVDELPEGLTFVRGWDLASSSKSTMKSDPDYTVGVKLAVKQLPSAIPGVNIPVIYVDDVIRGQWEATQRQKIIQNAAIADGYIDVGIEAFAAYKDSYTQLYEILKGIRNVLKMQLPGDKVAKASCLVPIFEAGNVYIKRAPWNDEFLAVINSFPGGAHDDDVDALTVAYNMAINETPVIFTSRMLEDEINSENNSQTYSY